MAYYIFGLNHLTIHVNGCIEVSRTFYWWAKERSLIADEYNSAYIVPFTWDVPQPQFNEADTIGMLRCYANLNTEWERYMREQVS